MPKGVRNRYEDKFGAKTFGEQLHLIRRAAELNQREVSELSGIGQASISVIERGKHVPTLRTLERLQKVFPHEDMVTLWEVCRRKEIEAALMDYRDYRSTHRLGNKLEVVVFSSYPENVNKEEIRNVISMLGYMVLNVEVRGGWDDLTIDERDMNHG